MFSVSMEDNLRSVLTHIYIESVNTDTLALRIQVIFLFFLLLAGSRYVPSSRWSMHIHRYSITPMDVRSAHE